MNLKMIVKFMKTAQTKYVSMYMPQHSRVSSILDFEFVPEPRGSVATKECAWSKDLDSLFTQDPITF